MTNGVLGIIACPMVDDNLVYSLSKDPEEKDILIVDNKNNVSIRSKLDKAGIGYSVVSWDDLLSGKHSLDHGRFTILVYMTDLGLHAVPEVLKSTVESLATEMQPFVDAMGFYLGTCGNFEWNAPAWCKEKGYKPSATFCDRNGRLCHDCVGINIAGGPKYFEMQKRYPGHMYVFPAMATNWDAFNEADSANSAATEDSITPDMRESLGIEPGHDGYMRWLLSLGGYEHLLRLDTGIGDREAFDRDLQKVSERTRLTIRDAEDGWADLQPTDDLYAKCKSLLSGE
ncbi:MAG: DUF1638 domain-containing protein [Candidatus Methanomethylophilaceae archaeon]|nr:DUF1638 domain-containing protein [Candidatus Methanomethylophilaceae archaeon]